MTFPQIAKHGLPIRTYSVNLSHETNIASFELKVEFYFDFLSGAVVFSLIHLTSAVSDHKGYTIQNGATHRLVKLI